jgi:hypothetical protein
MSTVIEPPFLRSWVYACVCRLTDNYEWQGDIEADTWYRFQGLIAEAIGDSPKALAFVEESLEHGIVEENYFGDADGGDE